MLYVLIPQGLTNASHTHSRSQMGWKTAAVALDDSSLPIGLPTTIELPPQQRPSLASTPSPSATFAAIYVDWLPPQVNSSTLLSAMTIFLSYRLASAPYDIGTPGFSDGLLMHAYSGTAQVRIWGGRGTIQTSDVHTVHV